MAKNELKKFSIIEDIEYTEFIKYFKTLPKDIRGSTVYQVKKCLLSNNELVK